MRHVIIGVQAQGLAFFRDFSIPVALVSERVAEVVVRQVIIGVQAEGLAVFRDRTIPVALRSERDAEAYCARSLRD